MRALSMRPAWFEDAKCYATDDPTRWDVADDFRGNAGVEARVRAVEACEGCPVARLCARTAIDEEWTGVVAAGVPLPTSTWFDASTKRPDKGSTMEALLVIEGGESMWSAVVKHFSASMGGDVLRRVLAEREEFFEAAGECGPPTPMSEIYTPAALGSLFSLSHDSLGKLRYRERVERKAGRDPRECVELWDKLRELLESEGIDPGDV